MPVNTVCRTCEKFRNFDHVSFCFARRANDRQKHSENATVIVWVPSGSHGEHTKIVEGVTELFKSNGNAHTQCRDVHDSHKFHNNVQWSFFTEDKRFSFSLIDLFINM